MGDADDDLFDKAIEGAVLFALNQGGLEHGFYIQPTLFKGHNKMRIFQEAGGGSSFSLEIPLGVRFLIRSRVFTEEELAELAVAEG